MSSLSNQIVSDNELLLLGHGPPVQLNDEVGVHVGQPGHLLCLVYVLHTSGPIPARSSSIHKLGHPGHLGSSIHKLGHPVQLHDEVVQHVGRPGHLLGLVVASPSSNPRDFAPPEGRSLGWVLVHLIHVEIINYKL